MKRWASIALAAMAAMGFLTIIALMWPLETLWITGPALIIPFFVWLLTSYKYPVESKGVVAIYMFALAVQMIHMGEEYLAGFHSAFQHLFDTEVWTERQFMLVAVFIGMVLYLAGGGGMLLGSRTANYLVWFYALGLGLSNAVAHFVLSVVEGGYFPGIYTAPLHLVMSIWLVYALVKENWRLRAKYEGTEESRTKSRSVAAV